MNIVKEMIKAIYYKITIIQWDNLNLTGSGLFWQRKKLSLGKYSKDLRFGSHCAILFNKAIC